MLQPEDNKKFLEKFNRFFRKAVNDYGLIPRGSTIIIGLSGGKDSLVLLEQIADSKFKKQKNIKVIAAHIVMSNISYQVDFSYLQHLCQNLEVPLVVVEKQFNAETDQRKSPCFLCSWTRRKALFDIAKQYNSNIIALGHHLDDMIETLLMNMAFQGSFSTMPPLLEMEKFDMKIIRPLSLLSEDEIKRYAEIKQFQPTKKLCPFEKNSFRNDIKQIVNRLVKLNPKARTSILASMTNIKTEYLPQKEYLKESFNHSIK